MAELSSTAARRQVKDASQFEAMVMRYLEDRLGVTLARPRTRGVLDIGDIWGIPHTTCEVKRYGELREAVRRSLKESEEERARTGTPLAVGIVRRVGKAKPEDQLAVMTLAHYATLLAMAMDGVFHRPQDEEYRVHVPAQGDVWLDEVLEGIEAGWTPPMMEEANGS